MSKIFSDIEGMYEKVGTAYYIAPEVLGGSYDEKCDIWSAGVILYILLSGVPPFNGEDDDEIMKNIQAQNFDFPDEQWKNISEDAKELIRKMLTTSNKRLSAEEVLSHPWVKKLAPNASAESLKLSISTFKSYSSTNKLKRAVLTFIASRLSEEEIQKVKESFQAIDVNGDGR